jgi:4-diphosphocytidyl-2-C-methyl-D-erythritol kinase
LEPESKAFAKINLHLEVLNRRPDGYHNILSLMAGIDLYDLLKLHELHVHDAGPAGIELIIVSAGGAREDVLKDIPRGGNLVEKAARLYFERAGLSGKAVFSLEKNIPAGAGMGGGSSDAAAALRMLNAELAVFDDVALRGLAAQVGADVPYCLTGGIAICEGIGEIIEPLNRSLSCWVLVADNGIHVNTAEAYRMIGRGAVPTLNEQQVSARKIAFRKAVGDGALDQMKALLKNDFEGPVFERYPLIRTVKERMSGAGALFAAMTGSGSSVVGLFDDYSVAMQASVGLKGLSRSVLAARML